jgi:regulator of sirC expression with transglutaminase-like and TPR domain
MKLARRVGVPMVGVNLPAHFMIRPVVEDMEVLVDCFKGGELVFVEDVEDMLKTYYTMGESEKLTIDRSFFNDNEVKPRSFFTRVLTNLKQIYFNEDMYVEALLIIAYQNHCSPDERVRLFNRRDGGICLFLMNRMEEAIEELSGYLEETSEKFGEAATADDGGKVEAMITAAKEVLQRAAVKRSVEEAIGKKTEDAAGADDAAASDGKVVSDDVAAPGDGDEGKR